jgi:hypothetical protein
MYSYQSCSSIFKLEYQDNWTKIQQYSVDNTQNLLFMLFWRLYCRFLILFNSKNFYAAFQLSDKWYIL